MNEKPRACKGCPNPHACQYGRNCRWPEAAAAAKLISLDPRIVAAREGDRR